MPADDCRRLIGVEGPPAPGATTTEVRRFLDRTEGALARIDRSLFRAWWNEYVGHPSGARERWDLARSRFLGRPDLFSFVRSASSRPHSPQVERRLELLRRIVEDAVVEQHPQVVELRNRLERRVMAFRPVIDGRGVTQAEARAIVRKDNHRSRRRSAYRAMERLSMELEDDLLELVEARNVRARALGYRSFIEFRLAADGLTLAALDEVADRVRRAGRDALRADREEFLTTSGESGFFPWDSGYASQKRQPFSDRRFPGRTMVRDVLKGIRAWGFRPRGRPFEIVRRSIPIGGMTLAIQIPSDVRVVVNPTGGWIHYLVLFHEFGHAVQASSTRAPTHLLRGPENIPGFAGFHEAMGALFENISMNVPWLRQQSGISSEQGREALEFFERTRARNDAWTAIWVRKEMDLYRRPRSNLASAFHRIDREARGYDDYPPSSFADPFWVDAAFYGKNYLIAAVLSAQLLWAMREDTRGEVWPNPKAVPWLTRHFFRHGAQFDWVPRVKEVTHRPFGSSDYLSGLHEARS
ncbi:MAG: hypothetical protein WCA77_08145 [Thermoplasmata archaeon]